MVEVRCRCRSPAPDRASALDHRLARSLPFRVGHAEHPGQRHCCAFRIRAEGGRLVRCVAVEAAVWTVATRARRRKPAVQLSDRNGKGKTELDSLQDNESLVTYHVVVLLEPLPRER